MLNTLLIFEKKVDECSEQFTKTEQKKAQPFDCAYR